MPSSKVELAIAKVLKDEGYIEAFKVSGDGVKPCSRSPSSITRGGP